MVDLAQAFSEIKSLPDHALQKEMSGGSLPGYLVLAELHERKRLRAGTGGTPVKRPSMVEDYIGTEVARAQFATGGVVQKGLTNPNMTYYSAAHNPAKAYGQPGKGGLASLVHPPMPMAPAGLASLVPQAPGRPVMPENKEPLNFAAGGIVSYLNQGATRRMPVTENLQARMAEAVQAVYGPGYTIGIYSGGQAEKGSGGPRTGSVRHDLGRAGDVYVFDPNGNKVTGDALAPLGQYWQARKYGGTGMEMHGGGIHLDEWEQPPSGGGMAWNYADQGGRYTKAQQAAIEAGQRGELPQLYGGATMASASSALTPHQMALVRTIYGDESGGKYNVVYGGGTFDTSGGWKHPGIYNQITSGPNAGQRSSAAGAGQFLESTWNDVAKRYGLKDFSPANQDLATYYLAKEKYGPDLDAVLASGDPNALAKVGQSLSGTWTSLPGGIESAGGTDRFVSAYQNALNNSGAGTAMASAANATTAANAELAAGAGAGEAAAGGMDPLTMMASLAKLGGGAAQPQAPTGGGAPQQPAIPYREEEIMRQRSQVSPLRRIA